jgi:hypothetical protein
VPDVAPMAPIAGALRGRFSAVIAQPAGGSTLEPGPKAGSGPKMRAQILRRRGVGVKCSYGFGATKVGASLIEYSILVALITVLIVVGVAAAGALGLKACGRTCCPCWASASSECV